MFILKVEQLNGNIGKWNNWMKLLFCLESWFSLIAVTINELEDYYTIIL
jgi:hypothetical protein